MYIYIYIYIYITNIQNFNTRKYFVLYFIWINTIAHRCNEIMRIS